MSDKVKLIIEIDEYTYKDIQSGKVYSSMRDVPQESVSAIAHGIPLDSVKAEIKVKCDRIDDIARANIYQYAPHREIQDLLCEILESIDKAESEEE